MFFWGLNENRLVMANGGHLVRREAGYVLRRVLHLRLRSKEETNAKEDMENAG